jgi:pyrroloquinoline quinone (PQQ) biosynthesis protein C
MDEQRQQKINEAAEQFADALIASFRTVSGSAVEAQERGAQLTQFFFNAVINNLRAHAEETDKMGEQLADQQQRQVEAARTLAQKPTDAYMDFLDSMLSFYQGSFEAAGRDAGETRR